MRVELGPILIDLAFLWIHGFIYLGYTWLASSGHDLNEWLDH